MRILVVGGGPAGLLVAQRIKQQQPQHQLVVIEKDPPQTGSGLGVVFSDAAVGQLQDRAPDVAKCLAGSMVEWDGVDIYAHGTRRHCGGHRFSGISRASLQAALRARCELLGVELQLGRRAKPADLAHADLVVAADGIHSQTRAAAATPVCPDPFETRSRVGRTRFIWLGATKRLEAFSFFFVPTRHGLFWAHAYPYDDRRSTFIVETSDAAYRAAGLDRMDERTALHTCEAIFAEALEGSTLFSSRSVWRRFPTVANGRWFHGRTVLIGDAAHTAHFSIGAGTKLAFDDGLALADALAEHGDVRDALAAYASRRQPTLARVQAVAATSEAWFEDTEAHHRLPSWPFAVSLLTRSGKLTRADLEERAPRFAAGLRAWEQLAERSGTEAARHRARRSLLPTGKPRLTTLSTTSQIRS